MIPQHDVSEEAVKLTLEHRLKSAENEVASRSSVDHERQVVGN